MHGYKDISAQSGSAREIPAPPPITVLNRLSAHASCYAEEMAARWNLNPADEQSAVAVGHGLGRRNCDFFGYPARTKEGRGTPASVRPPPRRRSDPQITTEWIEHDGHGKIAAFQLCWTSSSPRSAVQNTLRSVAMVGKAVPDRTAEAHRTSSYVRPFDSEGGRAEIRMRSPFGQRLSRHACRARRRACSGLGLPAGPAHFQRLGWVVTVSCAALRWGTSSGASSRILLSAAHGLSDPFSSWPAAPSTRARIAGVLLPEQLTMQ